MRLSDLTRSGETVCQAPGTTQVDVLSSNPSIVQSPCRRFLRPTDRVHLGQVKSLVHRGQIKSLGTGQMVKWSDRIGP
jgi:hypothetical protein